MLSECKKSDQIPERAYQITGLVESHHFINTQCQFTASSDMSNVSSPLVSQVSVQGITAAWNQRYHKWKKTENSPKGRPFCTPYPGKGFFSLRGRAICISVLRFSYWELKAPEEAHGRSGGAADTESRSLPHVIVFYAVRPSAEGNVSAACFAVPGCPSLLACPQHRCCLSTVGIAH